MESFRYQARHSGTSKIERGITDAENLTEATKKLRTSGFIVLKIEPNKGGSGNLNLNPLSLLNRRKVPMKEKIIFTRQLSMMLKAGLPVVRALGALARQTENKYFQEVIGDLIKSVEGGQTFSRSLTLYPKVFPNIYTAVVKAGEESGQLTEVLLDLADQQEKEADLVGKIRGALVYPGFIFCTLIAVVVLIIVFVLPSLKTIFTESNVPMPIQTRILLGLGDNVMGYYYVYIIVIIGLIIFARIFLKTARGQNLYGKFLIKMPIFGTITKKIYMARFSRTLALLTKASFPILKSIIIVKETINNVHYQRALDRVEKAVENGKPLSWGIEKEVLFPPMVSQLISLGEESGNLEAVLKEVSSFYDKEVDQASRSLSTMIEPLMMIIMGIGVAFVVLAVIGPIYGMVSAIN